MAKSEMFLHIWSSKIKITVFKTKIIICNFVFFNFNRRNITFVKYGESRNIDLNGSCCKLWIFHAFFSAYDISFNLDDVFTAKRICLREILAVRVKYYLCHTELIT